MPLILLTGRHKSGISNLLKNKSTHVNFNKIKDNYLPIMINSNLVPHENTAKYLGMTLNARFKWKEHVKKKQEELNIRYKKVSWLMDADPIC